MGAILIPKKDRIRVSDNFYADEFINPELYDKYGPERCLRMINPLCIYAAQWWREYWGQSVFLNNWARGGYFKNCGLRIVKGTKPSIHCFGNAIDPRSPGIKSYDWSSAIRENKKELQDMGLIWVEDPTYTIGKGEGWSHQEFGYTLKNDIYFFKP